MEQIHERIRALRLAAGLSQDELAKMVGYTSRSSVARIEAGDVDLPQSKILNFAAALDTTSAYLMGWTDDPVNYGVYPLRQENGLPPVGSRPRPPAEYAELKKEDREFVDSMIRRLAGKESADQ